MFYSYILKSEKDGKFYYGSTQNIEERLKKHNKGDVQSTKSRRPMILQFIEPHDSRSLAFQREKFYKSIDGYIFLKKQEII